jgi:uncharacterized membrane protein YbjE (DUF340 family)
VAQSASSGEITFALAMALESLQLCGVVVIGFLLGLTGLSFLQHATEASEYTLIFLLFLIGIQLRNNGMTLRQIVLNRRGMIVAVVVTASSLLGGVINAFILDLPLKDRSGDGLRVRLVFALRYPADRILWPGHRQRRVL